MADSANCPQCGTPVGSTLPGLPVVTCTSCNAMLTVRGSELSAVGESGTLPFDVSPLQIGTTLEVNGKRGDIVGRERWGWERGSWNEWLLYLPQGDYRWVAEESGLFMVMAPAEPRADVVERLKEIDRSDRKALGETVQHDKIRYTVADIKTVHCIASEGRLPEIVAPDMPRESIDLRTNDGRAMTFQSDSNGFSTWTGRYYRLSELSPKRLRSMQGWRTPAFGGPA